MGLRLSGTKACAWRRYITVTGFIPIFSKLTLCYPVCYGSSLSDATQQTKPSSLSAISAMLASSATISHVLLLMPRTIQGAHDTAKLR